MTTVPVVIDDVLISVRFHKSGVLDGVMSLEFGQARDVAVMLVELMFPQAMEVSWSKVEGGWAFVGKMPVSRLPAVMEAADRERRAAAKLERGAAAKLEGGAKRRKGGAKRSKRLSKRSGAR